LHPAILASLPRNILQPNWDLPTHLNPTKLLCQLHPNSLRCYNIIIMHQSNIRLLPYSNSNCRSLWNPKHGIVQLTAHHTNFGENIYIMKFMRCFTWYRGTWHICKHNCVFIRHFIQHIGTEDVYSQNYNKETVVDTTQYLVFLGISEITIDCPM
jgi:hypothetical protein